MYSYYTKYCERPAIGNTVILKCVYNGRTNVIGVCKLSKCLKGVIERCYCAVKYGDTILVMNERGCNIVSGLISHSSLLHFVVGAIGQDSYL